MRNWAAPFDPYDTTPGFNNEVVISDGLEARIWRRPHILGKTLRLDNDPAHVVGVMPQLRDQGQTSEERGTNCGRRGDLPTTPPAADARHAFTLRDYRAPSAWSLAEAAQAGSMPWLHR